MMKNKKHSIVGWFVALLVLLIIIVFGGSVYMLSYALTPGKNDGRDYAREYRVHSRARHSSRVSAHTTTCRRYRQKR